MTLLELIVLAPFGAALWGHSDPPEPRSGVPTGPAPDDSDADGVSDALEIARSTDPDVPGLFPGAYPHIPEPLVFDLVRGLGATEGEFEFNTLTVARFRPYAGLAWAPEIEWAFADRHALELELRMHDAHVDAFKVAVQGTVNERKPRFIHGWQVMTEFAIGPRELEITTLYLAGLRLGKRFALFGMIGPRGASDGRSLHADLVVNPSFFVDVAEVATIGIENNGVVAGSDSRVDIIPQIHLQLGRHFRIQLGGGVGFSREGISPLAAARLVIE